MFKLPPRLSLTSTHPFAHLILSRDTFCGGFRFSFVQHTFSESGMKVVRYQCLGETNTNYHQRILYCLFACFKEAVILQQFSTVKETPKLFYVLSRLYFSKGPGRQAAVYQWQRCFFQPGVDLRQVSQANPSQAGQRDTENLNGKPFDIRILTE